MRSKNRNTVLLAGAMMLKMAVIAGAQSTTSSQVPFDTPVAGAARTIHYSGRTELKPPRYFADVAATYSAEYARLAFQSCKCFWMTGGAINGSLNLFRGLGVAAEVSLGTASSVNPGVNASKLDFVAGPRYTYEHRFHRDSHYTHRIFVEALGGFAHGYNGLYPAPSGLKSSANSGAMQMGGGYDLGLRRGWGIRVMQAEWMRTTLPNGTNNLQYDLQASAGLSYRFGEDR